MILTGGMLYELNANLLRSIIQDWCIQHIKIPDTQFLSKQKHLAPPVRSHFNHAAQKMQSGSSWLYATVIDFNLKFKQACDCISRNKLWGHLRSCQMPDHILNVLKEKHAD